jgi:hypothetical protein
VAGQLVLGSLGSLRVLGLPKGTWGHDVVLLPLGPDRRVTVSTSSIGSTVRLTVLGYVS